MEKLQPKAFERYTAWTQATIAVLRERAQLLDAIHPDSAAKLRAAADAVDAAWEIVDEEVK